MLRALVPKDVFPGRGFAFAMKAFDGVDDYPVLSLEPKNRVDVDVADADVTWKAVLGKNRVILDEERRRPGEVSFFVHPQHTGENGERAQIVDVEDGPIEHPLV